MIPDRKGQKKNHENEKSHVDFCFRKTSSSRHTCGGTRKTLSSLGGQSLTLERHRNNIHKVVRFELRKEPKPTATAATTVPPHVGGRETHTRGRKQKTGLIYFVCISYTSTILFTPLSRYIADIEEPSSNRSSRNFWRVLPTRSPLCLLVLNVLGLASTEEWGHS